MISAVRLGRLIVFSRIRAAGAAAGIRCDGHTRPGRLIVYELECGAEEVGEDGCGDGAGAGLLAALAGHESEEGCAGAGDEGVCGGEVLHLAGGLAVFHGVEVALGGAGAGAAAAARAG